MSSAVPPVVLCSAQRFIESDNGPYPNSIASGRRSASAQRRPLSVWRPLLLLDLLTLSRCYSRNFLQYRKGRNPCQSFVESARVSRQRFFLRL